MMLLSSLVRCFRGFEIPSAETSSPCFEPLEARIVLAGSPFPDANTDLIDPANTVVRIETSMGDIDIELFDQNGPSGSTAPVTTANFLNYVRDGDWDESFFHRLALLAGNVPFVLQGGGFLFDDAAGLSNVPTDAPIVNEFDPARSNIERTIAMAKLGNDPNSATSQFFFNLGDNSANLDFQNGGFTVFGRVATDASWTVITNIEALSTADFSLLDGALGSTPVDASYSTGDPISESVLVTLIDVEIIKPASISASDNRFYSNVLAYPEGYRADTITESVALVNPGFIDSAYQIVVRYERGRRDQVIATGVLDASEHRTIVISDFNDPDNALVRGNVPYAIEVHSTGIFGASLTHTDFNATAHESFYNVMAGEIDSLPEAERMNWAMGGTAAVGTSSVDPNITRMPFLTYLNDSAVWAQVTVTFITQAGGTPITITKGLEPHRRGGLEVFSIAGVTGALTGIEINSTQPIVPALTVYEQHPSAGPMPVVSEYAYTAQLNSGAGQTNGVLAGVQSSGVGDNFLSIDNNNNTGAVVTFDVVKESGTTTRTIVISPNSRAELDLFDLIAPADGYVSIRYSSASTPVSVQYVSTDGDDLVSTSASNRASGFWTFTGGDYDPTGSGKEVISVFNPHQGASVVKQLQVRYYFSDGTSTTVPGTFQIDSGERLNLDISDLADNRFDAVRAKIQSAPEFSTYSITIFSTIAPGGPAGSFPTSVAVQMSQTHGGRNSSTTSGIPLGGINYVLLSDPALSGNIGF